MFSTPIITIIILDYQRNSYHQMKNRVQLYTFFTRFSNIFERNIRKVHSFSNVLSQRCIRYVNIINSITNDLYRSSPLELITLADAFAPLQTFSIRFYNLCVPIKRIFRYSGIAARAIILFIHIDKTITFFHFTCCYTD